MFKISYDKKITMVQGDTGVIRMRIHNYELSQGDEVRFAIVNKANPSILLCQHSDKKIVLEKQVTVFEKDGSARIILHPYDTEYLQPGKYLYEIQVKTKDGRIDTVVPLTNFTMMDGSIQGEYGQTTPSKPEPTPSEIELRFTRLESEIIPELGNRITNVENEIDSVNSSLDNMVNVVNSLNLPYKTINKMINGENVTIVCYGDSITSGVGSNGGQNYPYFLQIILREYYNNNNINVINCGVGGRRTTEFLLEENLQTVYNNNADLVIFMTAINDCNGSIYGSPNDIETYKNNLIDIYHKLKQYDLIFVTANDYISDEYNKTLRYRTYINTFKDVAIKYNVCLVDMNKELNNILKIENKMLLNALPDKIHPNSYYYKKISDIIFTFGLCSNRMIFEINEFISVMYPNFKYSSPSKIYTGGTIENYYKYNVVLKPANIGKFYLFNNKQNAFINVNIITLDGPISKNAQIKINDRLYNLYSFKTDGISTNFGNFGDYYKLDSGLNIITLMNNEKDVTSGNDLMTSGIKMVQINNESKYIKKLTPLINSSLEDVIIYKKQYEDDINTNKLKINFNCSGTEYGVGIGSNIIATGEEIPQFVLYKYTSGKTRLYFLNKTSTSEKISVGDYIELSGSISNGDNTIEIIKNETSYTIKVNEVENVIERNVINFGKLDIWIYLVGKGGNNQMCINEIIGES